jgi:distribution and morphology protein 10
MLDFMDHVQDTFYEASHWNVDNSYGALNATARGTYRLMLFMPA